MPDYLQPAAREIWMEELSLVMLAGVTERDSSLFAAYCSVEALNRAAFIAGEAPPAAYLTEQRRRDELLGIAGPRVRQGASSEAHTSELQSLMRNPYAVICLYKKKKGEKQS